MNVVCFWMGFAFLLLPVCIMLLEQQSLDDYTVIGNLAMEMFLPLTIWRTYHNPCIISVIMSYIESPRIPQRKYIISHCVYKYNEIKKRLLFPISVKEYE